MPESHGQGHRAIRRRSQPVAWRNRPPKPYPPQCDTSLVGALPCQSPCLALQTEEPRGRKGSPDPETPELSRGRPFSGSAPVLALPGFLPLPSPSHVAWSWSLCAGHESDASYTHECPTVPGAVRGPAASHPWELGGAESGALSGLGNPHLRGSSSPDDVRTCVWGRLCRCAPCPRRLQGFTWGAPSSPNVGWVAEPSFYPGTCFRRGSLCNTVRCQL